ncbi:MAG: hemerythrin domain-containing protein [Gammaproteobacteria bacterium]|uniref:Hemerythrin domain-containing protein n=1 Tax=Candidatus Thiopontia autotrophica TaxID=2841688 RepID=A0A8J6PA87_9GAMM|nr:hemerythrin domain-containing protein [Candidatus Thiopontia autotrophica]
MDAISDIMTHHHRACDELFSNMENAVSSGDWDSADSAWKEFQGNILNHFASEEETLFPAFEDVTGNSQGPTMVMKMEHEQMRSLLDGLKQAMEERHAEQVLGVADTLMMMIQQHNMKEEQILYPMIDQALSPAEPIIDKLTLSAE